MSLLFLTCPNGFHLSQDKGKESFPATCGPVTFLTPSLTRVPQSPHCSHTGLPLASNMPDPSALGLCPSHSLCLAHSCTSFKVWSDTSFARHFSRPSWLLSVYLSHSMAEYSSLPSIILISFYYDRIYTYIVIAFYISLLQDYKLHEDRIAFSLLSCDASTHRTVLDK